MEFARMVLTIHNLLGGGPVGALVLTSFVSLAA